MTLFDAAFCQPPAGFRPHKRKRARAEVPTGVDYAWYGDAVAYNAASVPQKFEGNKSQSTACLARPTVLALRC